MSLQSGYTPHNDKEFEIYQKPNIVIILLNVNVNVKVISTAPRTGRGCITNSRPIVKIVIIIKPALYD